MEVLEFIGMPERHDTITQNLSYGKQELLNIAIALAVQPKLPLMDELAAGMNPKESLRTSVFVFLNDLLFQLLVFIV